MKTHNEESDKVHRTVLQDLEPMLTLLKIWGALPLYHVVRSKRERIISRLHRIYSLIFSILQLAALFSFIYLYVKTNEEIKDPRTKGRVEAQYMVDIFISCICYCLVLCCCFKNAHVFNKILSDLMNYDIQQRKYFSEYNTKNLQAFTIVIIIWKIASYLIIYINFGKANFAAISSLIYYAVAIIGFTSPIFVIFLSVFMRVLAQRFHFLNKQLHDYIILAQHSNTTGTFTESINVYEDLLFIFRSHSKLLDILQAFNQYSSLMYCGIFLNSFYSAVSNSYYLFVFWTSNESVSFEYIFIVVGQIRNTTTIALISYSCGEVVKAANKTTKLISRIYTKNKEIYCLVDKYLSKSIQQRTEFSVKGFFNIDGSILFKIFAAVTTYVIILIQFKQLEEEEEVTNMADPNPDPDIE